MENKDVRKASLKPRDESRLKRQQDYFFPFILWNYLCFTAILSILTGTLIAFKQILQLIVSYLRLHTATKPGE